MIQAVTTKKLDAFQIMELNKDQLSRALPKHLTADRMTRIALTELRKNPKLQQCDPYSFMGAVIQSAQLGLEVGSGLGHAYLVPYKTECTLIVGYKGQVDLMHRSGRIKGVWAYVVYKEDLFEEGVDGNGPYLHYKAARLGKERKPEEEMIAAFAQAKFDDGSMQWTVMEKWEIDRIRNNLRYPSDIWRDHYGEMAKKTVVRRLSKMCPQSPEIIQVNQIEDGDRPSHQPFIDVGVIPDNYQPQGPEHDPEKTIDAQEAAANDTKLHHEQKAAEEKLRDELNIAIIDFQDTMAVFIKNGGDIKELKLMPIEIVKLPAGRIRAATQMMRDQLKRAGEPVKPKT